MQNNIKRRHKLLVIARDSKAAHFEGSIVRLDPKCILKKSSRTNVFTIVTSLPLDEVSNMTSVKTAEIIATFPIKMSELVEFYKKNSLSGDEIVLLKTHEHAPSNFATIDFEWDHQRFLLSHANFETPVGPLKLLEDQISLNRGDLELVAYDGSPIIYLSLICGMLVFGSH